MCSAPAGAPGAPPSLHLFLLCLLCLLLSPRPLTPPPPPLPPTLTQTQQTLAAEPEGGRRKRGQTIPGGLLVPEAAILEDVQHCLSVCLSAVWLRRMCLLKHRPRLHTCADCKLEIQQLYELENKRWSGGGKPALSQTLLVRQTRRKQEWRQTSLNFLPKNYN